MTDTLDDLLELWAKALHETRRASRRSFHDCVPAYQAKLRAEVRAIHDATTGAGLVVVPMEATDAMANAWGSLALKRLKARLARDTDNTLGLLESAKESYQAMLNASPFKETKDG